MCLAVFQPMTMPVHKSMTVARYNQPCLVLRYVISPTRRVPGVSEEKSRVPWSSIIAGGGSGSNTVPSPAHKDIPMTWYAGANDGPGQTNPPEWSALGAAEKGHKTYQDAGYSNAVLSVLPGVGHHDYKLAQLINMTTEAAATTTDPTPAPTESASPSEKPSPSPTEPEPEETPTQTDPPSSPTSTESPSQTQEPSDAPTVEKSKMRWMKQLMKFPSTQVIHRAPAHGRGLQLLVVESSSSALVLATC